jgi:hypothetical protein
MLDILRAVKCLRNGRDVDFTTRDAPNMALIRDDFPVPDCQMAFMSRSCTDDGEESYATNDKDPKPVGC